MRDKLIPTIILTAASLVLVGEGGCRMCASPYDHCNPLQSCRQGSCDPYERAGSVWSGSVSQLTQRSGVPPSRAPDGGFEDIVAQRPLSPIRILSITDKKVGESEESPEVAQQQGSVQISRAPVSAPRVGEASNTDGWTALR